MIRSGLRPIRLHAIPNTFVTNFYIPFCYLERFNRSISCVDPSCEEPRNVIIYMGLLPAGRF